MQYNCVRESTICFSSSSLSLYSLLLCLLTFHLNKPETKQNKTNSWKIDRSKRLPIIKAMESIGSEMSSKAVAIRGKLIGVLRTTHGARLTASRWWTWKSAAGVRCGRWWLLCCRSRGGDWDGVPTGLCRRVGGDVAVLAWRWTQHGRDLRRCSDRRGGRINDDHRLRMVRGCVVVVCFLVWISVAVHEGMLSIGYRKLQRRSRSGWNRLPPVAFSLFTCKIKIYVVVSMYRTWEFEPGDWICYWVIYKIDSIEKQIFTGYDIYWY